MFRSTVNSGIAQLGTAGTGGRGGLQGSTLEMSNVDLAQEFTNLIIAQRGFQANSKVISTSDEILNDLVNLKR
jgi:flagellar hook protein FlgE